MTGISLHKSFNTIVVEAGRCENMTCVEEECRNYIEKVRRLSLGDEGIVAIQSYFTDIQAQCVEFYFRANLGNDL